MSKWMRFSRRSNSVMQMEPEIARFVKGYDSFCELLLFTEKRGAVVVGGGLLNFLSRDLKCKCG
jgi:hypothetical protein